MIKSLSTIAILAAAAVPALATLGGSVAADPANIRAKHAVVEMQQYTVHETSREDGTTIREYATPAGKVFGVAWSGPVIPDLSELLGVYNTEFQNSRGPARARRKAAVVRNPDLVVESSGHTRAFYGRAYLNSLLPSGVAPDVIK